MYDPDFAKYNRGSYPGPVATPTGSWDTAPTICIEVSVAWVPYITGALSQLAQPTTWVHDTDTALWDVLGRVQDLIEAIGTAGACMRSGVQNVTILSGNAVGTIGVLFSAPFLAVPVIVVSESTGDFIASAGNVTLTGFDLSITANVNTIVDMPSLVSWVARVPS